MYCSIICRHHHHHHSCKRVRWAWSSPKPAHPQGSPSELAYSSVQTDALSPLFSGALIGRYCPSSVLLSSLEQVPRGPLQSADSVVKAVVRAVRAHKADSGMLSHTAGSACPAVTSTKGRQETSVNVSLSCVWVKGGWGGW